MTVVFQNKNDAIIKSWRTARESQGSGKKVLPESVTKKKMAHPNR
jgi:hypothetical protein